MLVILGPKGSIQRGPEDAMDKKERAEAVHPAESVLWGHGGPNP